MSVTRKSSYAEKRAFWRMVLETWRSSGLSVREFCKREGLTESSFYYWRRRLRCRSGCSPDNTSAPSEQRATSPDFIEITSSIPRCSSLELALRSGHTLRIADTIEMSHLSQVLQALQQVGLC